MRQTDSTARFVAARVCDRSRKSNSREEERESNEFGHKFARLGVCHNQNNECTPAKPWWAEMAGRMPRASKAMS